MYATWEQKRAKKEAEDNQGLGKTIAMFISLYKHCEMHTIVSTD